MVIALDHVTTVLSPSLKGIKYFGKYLLYLRRCSCSLTHFPRSCMQVAVMAPQLRGLLRRKLAREILVSLGLGLAAGAVYWYALVLPRRRVYEEFYRNYDAKAVADSMTASFEEGGRLLDMLTLCTPTCPFFQRAEETIERP